jgi:hypothetical protein
MTPTPDLFATTFDFATVSGSKILVLGIGGGADIVTAFAVSRLLPEEPARQVLYGNTKKRDDGSLEAISPHIHRLIVPTGPAPTNRRRAHGTTLIDQSVPRGPEGCPFIFLLPDRADAAIVARELFALEFDTVLAVDTGGDSITGNPTGGGRDKRMLRVLRESALPVLHIVVAPGSDGESVADRLRSAMLREMDAGRYRGSFSLAPVLPTLQTLSTTLEATRTPRIILNAAARELKHYDDEMIVPRGIKPSVPLRWLTHGFVFALAAK